MRCLLNTSLNVGNLAVDERHFQVPVDKYLLRAEVHNFLRLVQHGQHLVGTLPELNGLRLGLLLCRGLGSLRSALRLLFSLVLATALTLTLTTALVTVLAVAADGEHLSDRVFHRPRTGCLEITLGELEYDPALHGGRRVASVAGITGHYLE